MGNFLLRLPDELYEALRERAHEERRPMSKIVREAISKELSMVPKPPRIELPKENPLPDPLMLHCPLLGCDFESISGSAVCPRHGRKVR